MASGQGFVGAVICLSKSIVVAFHGLVLLLLFSTNGAQTMDAAT